MSEHFVRTKAVTLASLAHAYLTVKCIVLNEGYASEVDWQYEVDISRLDESMLLRETAWVILCSGMRERTIRHKFDNITEAFLGWKSARNIVEHAETCKAEALRHFNHPLKVEAIISVAGQLDETGFPRTVHNIQQQGISYLRRIPFIGPITCFHLAKNLGFPVAKPDRHLAALAGVLGYKSAQDLCMSISEAISEPIAVVDLVLWRYTTIYYSNQTIFESFADICANVDYQ